MRQRGVEIIDTEEESDSTGRLVTDSGTLSFSVCAGEQKPGLCARRADDDPPLGASVVGAGWRVLDKVEAKDAGEERDCWVVLVNDQGNQVDLHRASVRAAVPLARLRYAFSAADPVIRR